MPANEYNAWARYYRDFPFGGARGDLQAGVVASVVANCNRGKGSRVYNPADFIPQFTQKPQSPDEIIEARINKFMRVYH